MNDNAQPPQKPQPKPDNRTPIPIDLLLIATANAAGVEVPRGQKNESRERVPFIKAGVSNDIETKIEWRPWLRVYVVKRSKRVERTEKGKQVVTWEPQGKAFTVPEAWCVAVPAEDL